MSPPTITQARATLLPPEWWTFSADALRQLLKQRGLSTKEAAKLIGCGHRTVQGWTLGECSMSYADWVALSLLSAGLDAVPDPHQPDSLPELFQ